MKENKIRLTENDIRRMVRACINEVVENWEADVERRRGERNRFEELKARLTEPVERCGWHILEMFRGSDDSAVFTLAVAPNEEGRRTAEIGVLAGVVGEVLGKRVTPRTLKNENAATRYLDIRIK